MVLTTDGFWEVALESWPGRTSNQLTLSRHSNEVTYQTMSSTCTQSQLCTATPFSLFVQCHISIQPFSFVSYHVSLIEVFCR